MLRIRMSSIFVVFPICWYNESIYFGRIKLSCFDSIAFNSGNVHFKSAPPPQSVPPISFFAQFQFHTIAHLIHTLVHTQRIQNFRKRKLSIRFFAHQNLNREKKPKTQNENGFDANFTVFVNQLNVLYRFW